MAKIPTLTRGRLALIAILQRTSTLEVAARCRTGHARVSEWCSGVKRPSDTNREALAREYGIPRSAWDELLP